MNSAAAETIRPTRHGYMFCGASLCARLIFSLSRFSRLSRYALRALRFAAPLFRNIRHSGNLALVILQGVLFLVFIHDVIVRHQRNLADVCGYDVHGLSQAGGVAPERVSNEFGSFFNRGAKVVNSRSRLTIKNVVGPNTDCKELLVQLSETFNVVIDSL